MWLESLKWLCITTGLAAALPAAVASADDLLSCNDNSLPLEFRLAACDRAISAGGTSSARRAAIYKAKGIWLQQSRRVDEALDAFENSLNLDSRQPDVFVRRAKLLERLGGSGDYEKAIAAYDAALTLGAAASEVLAARAALHLRNKSYASAVADYDRILDLNPKDRLTQVSRAFALKQLKRYDEALAAVDSVLTDHPFFEYALSTKASIYTDQGDFKSASAVFDKGMARFAGSASTALQRGWVLTKLRDYAAAYRALTEAIEASPTDPAGYFFRGQVNAERDDFAKAMIDYDKAISLDGGKADYYTVRGWAAAALGMRERAFADFERALELEPEHLWALRNRGRYYVMLGDAQSAFLDAERALARDPKFGQAYIIRAYANLALYDPHGAETDLDHALEAEPGNVEALNLRAAARFMGGNEDGARADLESIEKIEVDDAWLLVQIGNTFKYIREADRSLAYYERALQLKPSQLDAKIGRANAYVILGDDKMAETALSDVLKTFPPNPWALETRGWIRYRQGWYDEAEADFKWLAEVDGQNIEWPLWAFISALRNGDTRRDAIAAARGKFASTEWPGILADILLGDATPADAMLLVRDDDPVEKLERRAMVNFYAAHAAYNRGNHTEARRLFEKVLAAGIQASLSYRAARHEIAREPLSSLDGMDSVTSNISEED